MMLGSVLVNQYNKAYSAVTADGGGKMAQADNMDTH